MRAGQLRHTVTIQQKSPSSSPGVNEFNEPEETWVDWAASVPAAKDPKSGREYFASQQRQSEIMTVWRIRFMDGVGAGMRVVYDGVNYDIKGVLDVGGRGITLDLGCTSGSAVNG